MTNMFLKIHFCAAVIKCNFSLLLLSQRWLKQGIFQLNMYSSLSYCTQNTSRVYVASYLYNSLIINSSVCLVSLSPLEYSTQLNTYDGRPFGSIL